MTVNIEENLDFKEILLGCGTLQMKHKLHFDYHDHKVYLLSYSGTYVCYTSSKYIITIKYVLVALYLSSYDRKLPLFPQRNWLNIATIHIDH